LTAASTIKVSCMVMPARRICRAMSRQAPRIPARRRLLRRLHRQRRRFVPIVSGRDRAR
jgi:hypothetical protein